MMDADIPPSPVAKPASFSQKNVSDIANNDQTVPEVWRYVDEHIPQLPEPRRETAPNIPNSSFTLSQKDKSNYVLQKDIGNSKWVAPDVFHFVDDNIG